MPKTLSARAQTAKRLYVNSFVKGHPITKKDAMLQAGYSLTTATGRPQVIDWNSTLGSIRDDVIAKRLELFALYEKDKRVVIESAREIFKLKDRYPAQKLKLAPLIEELNSLKESE